MGKIKQLDDNLSNLIAAGEVVENMASVVKELVENAIDASSKNIKIDLLDVGLNEIKVTDDGIGMSIEDMHMCFKRHATSKITTSHDLYHINTLGFRGEALPSIASVSHLEIISSEGTEGHRLFLLKGQVQEDESYAPRKGTSIAVRYLFYNTPARLKHLKATNTELSYIVDYVNKIALSHPNISFTLTNDRKTLFRSNGDGDTLKVLSNIYSIDIIKNMNYFNNKNAYFSIEGYIAKPEHTRSSRNHITMIANHRMIKNNKIVSAVVDGFKTYLPIGKYPIVFLKIDMDPLLIDVNIHPQKLEVKFTEERLLLQLIRTTIQERLQSLSLIPEIREKKKEQVKYETLNLTSEASEPSVVKEDFMKYINDKIEKKKLKESTETIPLEEPTVTSNEVTVKPESTSKKIPILEYIGQYLGTYLIAQNEQGLYLIDQHAAAERIRYESYYKKMNETSIETTDLLIPITLDLTNNEVIALQDKINDFHLFGINIEMNAFHGIDITTVPTWFVEGLEREYTEEIVRYFLEGKDISVGVIRDNLAKSLACKHSIKANKYINENEIKRLLSDLEHCENPYTCPHGRPVMITFTQTEIEKMFQRIMK